VEGDSGRIADQDEVLSVSVIKGLEGQGEDLTIIRTVADPKPEPSPWAALAESGQKPPPRCHGDGHLWA
jgi:hypothetical protein